MSACDIFAFQLLISYSKEQQKLEVEVDKNKKFIDLKIKFLLNIIVGMKRYQENKN